MTGSLRVALVGAGRAGMVHGRNFAAGVRGAKLAAVADPDPEILAQAASELECGRVFTDPVRAATDEEIDAVVIASPTFAHAECAIPALKAGKHVLCEKPLAATLDDAYAIRDAARMADGKFLMGFMRRFDNGFRRAAKRIAAGDIGEPLLIKSTGRGPGLPPEWAWDQARSGGLVAEVNSHDLDSVRWLSGQEYERVYAVGRAAKRPDVATRYPNFVDMLVATLELSGGAIGQIDGACPADYGYDARIEVYGSAGVVFAGDTRATMTVVVRTDGVHADPVLSWRTLFAEAYRAEDEHFAAAAHGYEKPGTSVEDGVASLEAAIATNYSLAHNEPVSIDLIRRL